MKNKDLFMERKPDKRLILFAVWVIIVGLLPLWDTSLKAVFESSAAYISPIQQSSVLGFSLAWIVFVFVVAWAIIKRKANAWLAGMTIFYFFVTWKMKFFFIFGTYNEGINIFMTLLVIPIFLLFSFDKKLRAQFSFKPEHLKAQKIVMWVFLITIISGPVFYCIYISPRKNQMKDLLIKPIQVKYTLPSSAQLSERYRRVETPQWSFLLPKRIELENKTLPGEKGLALINQDLGIGIFFDVKSSHLMDGGNDRQGMDIGKIIGIKTKYEMAKKILYEQVGVTFLILKALVVDHGVNKIYDLKTDHLKGFMFNFNQNEKNKVAYPLLKDHQFFHYVLFGPKGQTLDVLFAVNPRLISEQEINDIVASIKFEK